MVDFSKAVTASLPTLGLSEDEQNLIRSIDHAHQRDLGQMQLSQRYLLGSFIVQNLRIAVPEVLEFLRCIVGWPALAVEPYVDRLYADSFRISDSDDGDRELNEVLDLNGFSASQTMAFTDTLGMGRCWWVTGSPRETGGAPVVTAESPLSMHALWDSYADKATAAKQDYVDSDGVHRAVLMVPKLTLSMHVNEKSEWVLDQRDQHGFDFVPVERMTHGALTTQRGGRSAITPAIRSLTDEACRTLLTLVPAREGYSVPGLMLLGATESAFQNADGTAKTAWETYISTINAIERDESGELPTVFQKKAYDPSVFTKVLDWYASAVAGATRSLPQELGLYTQGNPASAESLLASDSGRNRHTKRMQREFDPALVRTGQNVMRFLNNGKLPEQYRRLSIDWEPPEELAVSLVSDAMHKQVDKGMVPPTSDVVLKKLGYSDVDRRRLVADRRVDDGRQLAAGLVASLTPGQPSGSAEPTPGV